MKNPVLKSWLPEGGENVFQRVKKVTEEVERTGKKLWPLTIGQPIGPALWSARKIASAIIKSKREEIHEYQDNGSPGVPDFAKRFIAAHFPESARGFLKGCFFLPIPGIKPMLGLIAMACGGIRTKENGIYSLYNPKLVVATMTDPGYGTPAVWCDYLGIENYPLKINTTNEFVFSVEDIWKNTQLLMLNYPHNPTGQIVTETFWEKICQFCQERGIRLFNDAAYAKLIFNSNACLLAEVASRFPGLSWAEAYSGSKAVANGTGWRVGTIVGSRDFVTNIATIKGNTDSGLVAAMAAGILHSMENDMPSIMEVADTYAKRTDHLIKILTERRMRLAVQPQATFFSTWLTPKVAFGEGMSDAEEFNQRLMQNTGVYGIPFGNLLRLTVTKPVTQKSWTNAIKRAFDKANVEY